MTRQQVRQTVAYLQFEAQLTETSEPKRKSKLNKYADRIIKKTESLEQELTGVREAFVRAGKPVPKCYQVEVREVVNV